MRMSGGVEGRCSWGRVSRVRTHNWGPGKVLGQEHILLLLCARHFGFLCSRFGAVRAVVATFGLRWWMVDAPRDVFTLIHLEFSVVSG